MAQAKSNYPLKISLLVVSLSWFLFTLYQFIRGSLYGAMPEQGFWLLLTDQTAVIGLAFSITAGFMAVVTVLLNTFRKSLSPNETLMTIRWILLAQAVYWLSLLPSGLWGIEVLISFPEYTGSFGFFFANLPCLIESLLMTPLLVKLFLALNSNKPSKVAIKWGFLSGIALILVFWFDNSFNWIVAVLQKGWGYLLFPSNLLSFGITTIGLLALALFAVQVYRKSSGVESFGELNFRMIGAIILGLGLYFDAVYLLWVFFGSAGGWGSWYAWILGHNMNLWAMSLPLLGLPMLFERNNDN